MARRKQEAEPTGFRVAEALRGLLVNVTTITPHPENPNQGDVGAIMESLSYHGQLKPLVVQDSTGFIVAGNHTYQAARQLGAVQVAAARIPMTDEQARRFLLADNRTAELAHRDDEEVARLLADLHAAGGLDGTGYTGDDLDDLLRRLEVPDLDTLRERHGEPPGEETFWPVIRLQLPPEVHARYEALIGDLEGDRERDKFARLLGLAEGAWRAAGVEALG